MRGGSLTGLLALTVAPSASCSHEATPHPPLDEPRLVLADASSGEVPEGWRAAPWNLGRASPALDLLVADIEPEPLSMPRAEVVSLADGAILAQFRIHPHPYESLVCYLELEAGDSGWRPRGAGLYFGCCVSVHWVEELTGRVTIDARDPTSLVCRVDLSGSGWGTREHEFVQDFRVSPQVHSPELRQDISLWWPELKLR